MAGFQLSINGRFWVSTEASASLELRSALEMPSMRKARRNGQCEMEGCGGLFNPDDLSGLLAAGVLEPFKLLSLPLPLISYIGTGKYFPEEATSFLKFAQDVWLHQLASSRVSAPSNHCGTPSATPRKRRILVRWLQPTLPTRAPSRSRATVRTSRSRETFHTARSSTNGALLQNHERDSTSCSASFRLGASHTPACRERSYFSDFLRRDSKG
jgi:hypothetical protein